MNLDRLNQIADRLGAGFVLDKLGLRGTIGEAIRLSLSHDERKRWKIILQDYRKSIVVFTPIVRDVPPGDSGRKAWFVGSMNPPGGLKLDGFMSLVARAAGFAPFTTQPVDDPWSRRYHAIFRIG